MRTKDRFVGPYLEYRYIAQSFNRYIKSNQNCTIEILVDLAM